MGKIAALQVDQELLVMPQTPEAAPAAFNETAIYVMPERFRSDIVADQIKRTHLVFADSSLTVIDGRLAVGENPFDRYQRLLRSRTRRMEGLIDGILEYSRLIRTETEEEEVDVGHLLRQTLLDLQPPPGFEIEVAIISDGSRRLVGQVVPAHVGRIELRFGDRSMTTESDSLGRFSFEDVPLGPISLQLELADGAVVQTAWTLV